MLTPRFDYRSYLALAAELANCPSDDGLHQAKLRSAISRAYYAVHLHIRLVRGIDDVPGHRYLVTWLRTVDSDWGRDANVLLLAREDCDYDREIRYDLRNKAKECVDIARELMDELDSRKDS